MMHSPGVTVEEGFKCLSVSANNQIEQVHFVCTTCVQSLLVQRILENPLGSATAVAY